MSKPDTSEKGLETLITFELKNSLTKQTVDDAGNPPTSEGLKTD